MELKKVNWSLTLIFCLLFGGLGYIIGAMSNCGSSNSCKAPQQSCAAYDGGACSKKMKCSKGPKCSQESKCKKSEKGTKKEIIKKIVEIEVEEDEVLEE